jgi:ribose 5-phosphate isomerase B
MAKKPDKESPAEPAPPRGQRFMVGSDHAGFDLKEQIKRHLVAEGNEVEDLAEERPERSDFPPVAEAVGEAVAAGRGDYGILVCGTGIGMSMAANRVPGIRAALLYDEKSAEYSRRHNDANVLVFGGRTMDFEQARRRLGIFFQHSFEGGRYARRNEYLRKMDEKCPEGKP